MVKSLFIFELKSLAKLFYNFQISPYSILDREFLWNQNCANENLTVYELNSPNGTIKGSRLYAVWSTAPNVFQDSAVRQVFGSKLSILAETRPFSSNLHSAPSQPLFNFKFQSPYDGRSDLHQLRHNHPIIISNTRLCSKRKSQ